MEYQSREDQEAVSDKVLIIPRKAVDRSDQDSLAHSWMNRGLALLRENTEASLEKAICSFDQAIELRRMRASEKDPWVLYALAAAWMNRGDALTRLGGSQPLAEAVHSYDEALAVLSELQAHEHCRFRERLAIAWMNRGISLQAQVTPASLDEAIRSFDESIAVLRDREAGPDHILVLATAWMNRGNSLLRSSYSRHALAREAAQHAIQLVSARERNCLPTAEIALNARHVLCRAIAYALAEDGGNRSARSEFLAEATDAVDAAMELVRQWESRGVARFRQIAREFFRFGERVYQMFQPHFLTEFLLENLDPQRSPGAMATDRDMHASAIDALRRSASAMPSDGFSWVNTPRFDRLLETMHELGLAETRLSELRRLHLAGD